MQKIMLLLMILSVTLFGGNLLCKAFGESNGIGILHDAFAATDAVLIELTMNGWAKVSSFSLGEEQLKGLVKTGSQAAFGLIPARVMVTDEDGFSMAQASYTVDGFNVEVSAQSLKEETYLIVTVQTRDKAASVEEAERRLKMFFRAAGLKAELTTCLVGVVEGRLSPDQAAAVVGKVLAILRAEMQESYSDGTVTNVIGYSKVLPGGVRIGGRTQNVSLTVRYNPNDGYTYVWLAWPTFSLPI